MALCIKSFLIFAVNQDSEFALDSDSSQTLGCIQTITIFVNKIQISGFYPRITTSMSCSYLFSDF